jgi:hypothetical protein
LLLGVIFLLVLFFLVVHDIWEKRELIYENLFKLYKYATGFRPAPRLAKQIEGICKAFKPLIWMNVAYDISMYVCSGAKATKTQVKRIEGKERSNTVCTTVEINVRNVERKFFFILGEFRCSLF